MASGLGDGSRDIQCLTLESVKRAHILAVLQAVNWNRAKAARVLDVSRQTVDRYAQDLMFVRLHVIESEESQTA